MSDRLVAGHGGIAVQPGSGFDADAHPAPQASLSGSRPTRGEHGGRPLGRVRGHREMYRPPPALGRVHDLQVLDVHVALAQHRGEAREGSGPVRHLDLQDGDARADRRLRGQPQPRPLRLVERRLARLRRVRPRSRRGAGPAGRRTGRSPPRSPAGSPAGCRSTGPGWRRRVASDHGSRRPPRAGSRARRPPRSRPGSSAPSTRPGAGGSRRPRAGRGAPARGGPAARRTKRPTPRRRRPRPRRCPRGA